VVDGSVIRAGIQRIAEFLQLEIFTRARVVSKMTTQRAQTTARSGSAVTVQVLSSSSSQSHAIDKVIFA